MKSRPNILISSLLLALALTACSKNETSPPTAAETSAPGDAEVSKKVEAVKAVEASKIAETPAVIESPKAPEPVKPVEDTTIQDLIAKARALVAEQRYAEASSVVQQLASKTLNNDQATLVDRLKQQIQTAMAAKATENAGSALKNILPK